MRVQDQDKSNCDFAYMASFWRKNQLVQTKKKNGVLGFEEYKLGFKVALFLIFFSFSLFFS
jgi:hypothetical protein